MKKKGLFLILGVICLILCLICVYFVIPREPTRVGAPSDPTTEPPTAATTEATTEPTQTPTQTEEPTEEPTQPPYESPVDFAALHEITTDAYAWLEIPGTDISYPVAQNAIDDEFYLYRDLTGVYSVDGTLFTQHLYNGLDFDDPVTIIYGHHMRSGRMFGNLQADYSDADTFAELHEIVIYCPDKELHYEVFAAVPYSNEHILYKYRSFQTEGAMTTFLNEIYSTRAFNTNFNDDIEVTEGDRVLVLSTCLAGNNTRRYLVLAKLIEQVP